MPTCSADGCERDATRTRRTWCEMHYYRLRRTGRTDLIPADERARTRVRAPRPCTVADCTREATCSSQTLCTVHYKRLARTGSVELPERPGRVYAVADCGKPRKTLDGLCGMHHERLRKHGSPEIRIRGHWTGDAGTYAAVHQRLAAERGRAAEHRCVDCGHRAAQWSYSHANGCGHRESDTGPYSVDLTDYEPRCVSCHKRFDLDRINLTTRIGA